MSNPFEQWQQKRLWAEYLAETDPRRAEQKRQSFYLKYLQPVVVRIVARKMKLAPRPGPDPFPEGDYQREAAAEVFYTAQALVLAALQDQWSNRTAETIENPENYAAALTFQAFHDHLEQKNPEWRAMKQAILYLLKSRPDRLALARVGKRSYCCLPNQVAWLEQNPAVRPTARWEELEHDPEAVYARIVGRGDGSLQKASGRETALVRLLAWVGQPVPVDEMTDILLKLSGTTPWTALRQGTDDDSEDPLLQIPSGGLSPEQQVLLQGLLQRVWQVFPDLSLDQRRVLTLTWESSGEATLPLFVEHQVMQVDEVAPVCEWGGERLLALWVRLVLPDREAAPEVEKQENNVRQIRFAGLVRLRKELVPWS